MVYTDAARRATLNYRRKNVDKIREQTRKYVTASRSKWASFNAQAKAFRKIDYS